MSTPVATRPMPAWDPDVPGLRLLDSDRLAHAPTPGRQGDLEGAAVLAYVPGQRLVLRLGRCVLKSYADAADFEVARAAVELLSDSRHLPIPPHLGSDPEHRLTSQGRVSGAPARRCEAVSVAGPAGGLLREVHAAELHAPWRRGPHSALTAAGRAARRGAAGPGRSRARLLRRLGETASAGVPPALSHGDLGIDQPRGGRTRPRRSSTSPRG